MLDLIDKLYGIPLHANVAQTVAAFYWKTKCTGSTSAEKPVVLGKHHVIV